MPSSYHNNILFIPCQYFFIIFFDLFFFNDIFKEKGLKMEKNNLKKINYFITILNIFSIFTFFCSFIASYFITKYLIKRNKFSVYCDFYLNNLVIIKRSSLFFLISILSFFIYKTLLFKLEFLWLALPITFLSISLFLIGYLYLSLKSIINMIDFVKKN